VLPEEALPAIRALGFAEPEARALADHFLDAERRGKLGHGLSRVPWLATLEPDPAARPRRVEASRMKIYTRKNAAVGYLTLQAIQRSVRRKRKASPAIRAPQRARGWYRLLSQAAGPGL